MAEKNTTPRTYTPEELAEILQVTKRTVYSYIKAGKIRAIKIGKYWRTSQKALDDFLNTGTEGK